MKKLIYLVVAVMLCVQVSAQVKSTTTTPSNSKGGAVVGTGPKAKATPVLLGKSSGTIAANQLANAMTLDMSDQTKPSSFKLTLSCPGSNDVSYTNTQNNELTKEMKALFARSAVGCTITFSNIVVNGKPVDPIKLVVQ